MKLFSSQSSFQASSSQVGASSLQDDNKKISFYLKLGKYKKFKFM